MSFVQTCSEFGRINTIQTKRLVFPFHRESYGAMLKVTCNEHMALPVLSGCAQPMRRGLLLIFSL